MSSLSDIIGDKIIEFTGRDLYLVYDINCHFENSKLWIQDGTVYKEQKAYTQISESNNIGIYTSIESAYDSVISYIYNTVVKRYSYLYPKSQKHTKLSDITKKNIANVFYIKDDFVIELGYISARDDPILLNLNDAKKSDEVMVFRIFHRVNVKYGKKNGKELLCTKELELSTTLRIKTFKNIIT